MTKTILPSTANPETGWSFNPPTKSGIFLWRKNWQWEAIEREVVNVDGVLKVYSHRWAQWVTFEKILGEWKLEKTS